MITVIGAGLAGSEAAWQAARQGVPVRLVEMKPARRTPAHAYDGFAELVCSNSLKADRLENAAGLLKQELRTLDSLILRAADATRVPAGGALAVDREAFSDYVTRELRAHPLIEVEEREVESLGEFPGIIVVATGPLTTGALFDDIARRTGEGLLHFFDAAAPIVTAESIDRERAFAASRYGRGDAEDYLNCPMDEVEYRAFYEALCAAECAPVKEFEQNVFEGCMPVEVMAGRGFQTLLFGPLKPVGLADPRTGKTPFAVVQLRKEDAAGTLYNLVGFQTHLKFPEQRRVFGMIPALREAEFVRYGVMHRNTFLQSPALLDAFYRLKAEPRIFFAGQMTGVEGYVESAASGWYAGYNAARQAQGKALRALSTRTAIGALAHYVSSSVAHDFQPMHINFGIIEESGRKIRKKAERNAFIAGRALEEAQSFAQEEEHD